MAGLGITDNTPLADFTNLVWLGFDWDEATCIAPLEAITGIGAGDSVWLQHNFLDLDVPNVPADLQTLLDRGVELEYEPQGH